MNEHENDVLYNLFERQILYAILLQHSTEIRRCMPAKHNRNRKSEQCTRNERYVNNNSENYNFLKCIFVAYLYCSIVPCIEDFCKGNGP